MFPTNQTSEDDDSLTDVSLLIKPDSSAWDDTLFQSLISYASSFNLGETVCSMQDLKNQFDSNRPMNRKSSETFSSRKINDYNSDESTTITEGSKFQWEHVPNTKDQQSKNKSMISPIIVYEKLNDSFPPQDICNRYSPKPIIVREILKKPSIPASAKPPMAPKRQKNQGRIPTKKTIIESDHINARVDQNIKEQKEIKGVNPYKYVQRYGTSLYAREMFRNLLTKIIV